jgi:glutaconate CoA-transferase subunit A
MPYEYFSDEEHLCYWFEMEKDLDRFRQFLETYIYGVRSFTEYLSLCGGLDRLRQLRQQELLLHLGK